jgi:hypothetical protein
LGGAPTRFPLTWRGRAGTIAAMAAHAMMTPPHRRWPARVAAIIATAALLGCGVAIAVMVIPAPEEEAVVPPPAAPAAEKPAAKPDKPGLTPRQRAERRAAVAVLAAEDFTPVRLADWRPKAELQVLVGRHAEGGNRAFFFADGEMVGTDDRLVSGKVRVAEAGRRAVTLSYWLYEAGDEACCPSGGEAEVSFSLQDGALVPDVALPPLSQRRATS